MITYNNMDDNYISKSPIPNKWDTTRMEIIKFKYMWTISNFSYFLNNISGVDSPTFSTETNNKIKWYLCLYPDGSCYSDSGNMALYLHLKSCDAPSIEAKCKFSIINNRREETNIRSSRYCHKFRYMIYSQNRIGLSNFISRDFVIDPVNGLLPNDTLTIFCEIRVCRGIINILGLNNFEHLKISKTQRDNLGALLESEEFSDVSIIVGRKEFKVHKVILAARSPVFLAMFKHDMKEKNENIVEIHDIDEKVMQEVLRFIYTGRVEKIEELANDLLAAAEKYSLEGLKIICEEALCGKLTIHNAADVLALADKYNANCLRTQVIHFLTAHGKDPSLLSRYLNTLNKSTSILTRFSGLLNNYMKLLIIAVLCGLIAMLSVSYASLLVDPMCNVTAKFCAHKDIVIDSDTVSITSSDTVPIALRKMQKSSYSYMKDLYAFISYFFKLYLNFIINQFSKENEFQSEN